MGVMVVIRIVGGVMELGVVLYKKFLLMGLKLVEMVGLML